MLVTAKRIHGSILLLLLFVALHEILMVKSLGCTFIYPLSLVVGAIIVTGGEEYPTGIRVLGAIALFASMTNIVSGFLITNRMLKMFKTSRDGAAK